MMQTKSWMGPPRLQRYSWYSILSDHCPASACCAVLLTASDMSASVIMDTEGWKKKTLVQRPYSAGMECSLRQRRRRGQGRGQQRAGAGRAPKHRRPRSHRSRRGRRSPSSPGTAMARSWLRTGRQGRPGSSGDLAASPRSALSLSGCTAGLPRCDLSPQQAPRATDSSKYFSRIIWGQEPSARR